MRAFPIALGSLMLAWSFACLAQQAAPERPGDPAQSPDATEIIRKSLARDMVNFERLKNYTYHQRDEERAYDKQGKLKKKESQTYEVLILGGHDYERLIAKDDQPLPEKDVRKEQAKLDQEAEHRAHESEADKAKIEKQRLEERKFLDEVPQAFAFRLLGEDEVSGKPAWVIQADPRRDYKAKDRRAKLITKLHGKVWIDKNEYQWVKVEAEASDTVSFGLGLLRIEPGATVRFEQTRVNDEVWLPASAKIYANAKVAIFKNFHSEIDITFQDYKKFQSDSHLVISAAQ